MEFFCGFFFICGMQSTSATHFSYSSKCRRTSMRKTYRRVFDFSNQKARVRAIYFAINDWSRVLVVATYLSICLTPKTLNLAVSHQNILANNSVYKLWEIENAVPIKYRTKNITSKYFPRRNVFQLHAFANTAVAWRFCESSRHISRSCNLQPHQQRYANKISNPKPQYNFHNYIRNTTSPKSPTNSPFWRRYTFLSHLATKLKFLLDG